MQIGCAVNQFARRHTKESPYSYFDGDLDAVVKAMSPAVVSLLLKDGVALVPVSPKNFYTGVVEVDESTELEASFEARRPTEGKVIVVRAKNGNKLPAEKVDLVFYSHDKLGVDATTDYEFELVSINARCTDEEEPPTPVAMARNYLGLNGGTQRSYTAGEFARAIIYWSSRAMSAGQ